MQDFAALGGMVFVGLGLRVAYVAWNNQHGGTAVVGITLALLGIWGLSTI